MTLIPGYTNRLRHPRRGVNPLRIAFLTLFLIAACTLSLAQTVLEGTVHDPAGAPVANASVQLVRENGSAAQTSPTAADGSFHFNTVEAGPYTIKVDASGFYPAEHRFVLRPRQPLSLAIDLQRKETVQEKVEVRSTYQTIDPEKTGSSYTFTHAGSGTPARPVIGQLPTAWSTTSCPAPATVTTIFWRCAEPNSHCMSSSTEFRFSTIRSRSSRPA